MHFTLRIQIFLFLSDHPHHGVKILGSGWGSKLVREETRMNWQKAWNSGFTDKLVWAKRNDYGPDQTFLKRYIFPFKKKLKSFIKKKIVGMCGIGPKPAQLVMIRIHVKIIPGPKDFQLNEKMSPITL